MKAERKIVRNQQDEGEEFKWYVVFTSDGYVALKAGGRGQRGMKTQRQDVKSLLYSGRLLMMMVVVVVV